MQMIMENIVAEIAQENQLEFTEISELKKLLSIVEAETLQVNLVIPNDRWLAVAVHLLGFIRRINSGETLPPVDHALFAEIAPEMVSLSARVFDVYGEKTSRRYDQSEIMLMAVHFETAKSLQEELGGGEDGKQGKSGDR
ncbi:PRD domain-containing protein [Brevibacillus humidisoli]|uniref:PRD domain-containing protein n=1 Tax=Brevibacillus humidisoli TaxID=2895522 RepID=UPI001E56CA89|nr:PRD domain-containing protein [Brevibacillus humidisoli]UFJ39106.1 PRD domain-containing protein [Brevibacillus humidisoli]